MRKLALAAALCCIVAVPCRTLAAGIPVRVRVLAGKRQGPPQVDPRLKDLQAQLSPLAWQTWTQVKEEQRDLEVGKPASFSLPDGSALELTIQEAKKDTVTFQLKVPRSQTASRLTISKDQRIVHQVAPEKDGTATFVSIRPWP
ncbi:hypothetical protein [Anaeromyxobacter paludicola]|uniref:Uncharacterized protein n=1 Tax=Anaeromyxobacter paludicola TaxID=2918171 RepID=A0ABM7XCN1_9BACT|nr:hypothetical protein [Anaeromyxobacter paludicola]BDG09628.1 hypothetical protein AMPC_27410 [Anaeromyxobacter paludicola]